MLCQANLASATTDNGFLHIFDTRLGYNNKLATVIEVGIVLTRISIGNKAGLLDFTLNHQTIRYLLDVKLAECASCP